MVKKIQDIMPTGVESHVWVGAYDEAKAEMEKEGFSEIVLAENARLRIQQGKDTYVSQNGNWVKEDAIYIPNKGKFLTKVSHISANAKEATNCHRNGGDFYLTNKQVEQALSDSVELSVKSVPTNRFADDRITIYAFGEDAEKYGEFLNKAGIKEMPIYTTELRDKPFARKVWFWAFGGGSGLDCDGGGAGGCGDRVRGVRESAEGTAKNSGGQIKTPNIVEIVNYTKRFVPEAVRGEFEKGLAEKLKQ